MKKPVMVELKKIRVKFFVRVSLNGDRVEFLKKLYEQGEQVDAIIITPDKENEGDYELVAGRHRVEAVKQSGYNTIPSEIRHYKTEEEKVLDAMLENMGGSLPPTQADICHTIELLINLGKNRKEIIESFPMPAAVTQKYHKLTLGQIYKRTIRNAVESVVNSKMTVKQAAEKYKCRIEDLKYAISHRTNGGEGIENMLKGYSTFVRSYAQNMAQKNRRIAEMYEAGEIGKNDVRRFMRIIKDSAKRLNDTAKEIEGRLEKMLNPPSGQQTAQIIPLAAKSKDQ